MVTSNFLGWFHIHALEQCHPDARASKCTVLLDGSYKTILLGTLLRRVTLKLALCSTQAVLHFFFKFNHFFVTSKLKVAFGNWYNQLQFIVRTILWATIKEEFVTCQRALRCAIDTFDCCI